MRHILEVFVYELGRSVRRRGYLFSTFGVPIIAIALLFGYQALQDLTADDSAAPVAAPTIDLGGISTAGYVDESGLLTVPADDLSEVLVRYPDEAAALSALNDGEIDVYYHVPPDYLETGDVRLVMPTLSVNKINTSLIRQHLLDTLAADVDRDIYLRLQDPSNIEAVALDGREVQGAPQQDFGSSFLLVYIFTLALMMGLFLTSGYLMQGLIEEKETRIIEILISSLRPMQLLTGKILAFGLMGMLQMIVWVGAVVLVLQFADALSAISILATLYLPLDVLPLVAVYFVLAYLLFATAYGIVGALSASMQEGPQFAIIFTLPAALPLYFISLFVEAPDAPLAVGLSLFPITGPVAMTMRLVMGTVPGWQIALGMALLVFTIVAMLWLAGRLFRVQTLLAGQAPKLRDLPKLIRG